MRRGTGEGPPLRAQADSEKGGYGGWEGQAPLLQAGVARSGASSALTCQSGRAAVWRATVARVQVWILTERKPTEDMRAASSGGRKKRETDLGR
jgi:hypothetical protein